MIQVIRETHEPPTCVAEALLRAGGVNRFGEPNFRAVWGGNRLTWIGGKWEDRNERGVLLLPRRNSPPHCHAARGHGRSRRKTRVRSGVDNLKHQILSEVQSS